jgi:hypothetical protein
LRRLVKPFGCVDALIAPVVHEPPVSWRRTVGGQCLERKGCFFFQDIGIVHGSEPWDVQLAPRPAREREFLS